MFIQKRKEAFNEKPPFFLLFLSDRRGSNPRLKTASRMLQLQRLKRICDC